MSHPGVQEAAGVQEVQTVNQANKDQDNQVNKEYPRPGLPTRKYVWKPN